MKLSEFVSSIKELEAATVTSRTDDAETIETRRMITFKVLREFPVDVLRTAIVNLCQDPEVKFFPPTPKIYQACAEVAEVTETHKGLVKRSLVRAAEHVCSTEKPENNQALGMLALLSAYEAAHICCPVDVPATCRQCGARRIVVGIFDKLIENYPDQTIRWTRNFKGFLTCEECEEASRTSRK